MLEAIRKFESMNILKQRSKGFYGNSSIQPTYISVKIVDLYTLIVELMKSSSNNTNKVTIIEIENIINYYVLKSNIKDFRLNQNLLNEINSILCSSVANVSCIFDKCNQYFSHLSLLKYRKTYLPVIINRSDLFVSDNRIKYVYKNNNLHNYTGSTFEAVKLLNHMTHIEYFKEYDTLTHMIAFSVLHKLTKGVYIIPIKKEINETN